MIVRCAECGKTIERKNKAQVYFCCTKHRDMWNRRNTDYSKISKMHKAKNLTILNRIRNPMCRVAERGKPNSAKARKAAAEYLGRPLKHGEVVHHMNGNASDNRHENLLIMSNRQHKQLHMALAIEQYEKERGENDGK